MADRPGDTEMPVPTGEWRSAGMPWWPLWGAQRGRSTTTKDADAVLETLSGPLSLSATLDVARPEVPAQRTPDCLARPVTMRRVGEALDRLEIRYLTDGDGSLLAM